MFIYLLNYFKNATLDTFSSNRQLKSKLRIRKALHCTECAFERMCICGHLTCSQGQSKSIDSLINAIKVQRLRYFQSWFNDWDQSKKGYPSEVGMVGRLDQTNERYWLTRAYTQQYHPDPDVEQRTPTVSLIGQVWSRLDF